MVHWLKWRAAAQVTAAHAACGGDGDSPRAAVLAEVARSEGFAALNAAGTQAGLAPTL